MWVATSVEGVDRVTSRSGGRGLESAKNIRRYLPVGPQRFPTREELKLQLKAFLRWWAAELWACLPDSWRNRLRHRQRHLVLRFEDAPGRVIVAERSDVPFSRSFALPAKEAPEAASLAEIQRVIKREGARLDAVVPEAHIIRREMKLPLTAQEKLRDALALDLNRYTRFQAKDVYFGYTVAETDLDAKTITVNAAIVERQRVDDMVSSLRSAGLHPSGVCAWRSGANRPD